MEGTEEKFDPTHNPEQELWKHIALKAWQAGAVLGLTAGIPYLLYKRQLSPSRLADVSAKWAVGGLVGVTALCYGKLSTIDRAGFEDRAYRLHFNTLQNYCDQFSLIGAGVGAVSLTALKVATGKGGLFGSIVGGAAIGTAFGVAAHMPTSMSTEGPNKMVDEAKSIS